MANIFYILLTATTCIILIPDCSSPSCGSQVPAVRLSGHAGLFPPDANAAVLKPTEPNAAIASMRNIFSKIIFGS